MKNFFLPHIFCFRSLNGVLLGRGDLTLDGMFIEVLKQVVVLFAIGLWFIYSLIFYKCINSYLGSLLCWRITFFEQNWQNHSYLAQLLGFSGLSQVYALGRRESALASPSRVLTLRRGQRDIIWVFSVLHFFRWNTCFTWTNVRTSRLNYDI